MIREQGSALALDAVSASTSSDWLLMARTLPVSITVRVAVTAATLAGTLTIKGTDFDAKSGSEATCGVFAAGPAPTGFSFANGVLTFANPSIGTSEIVLQALGVPRWLRLAYTFTSGGGTVAVSAAVSAW